MHHDTQSLDTRNFTIMSIIYLIYCAFKKSLDSKPIEIEGLEKPYIPSGYDTQNLGIR